MDQKAIDALVAGKASSAPEDFEEPWIQWLIGHECLKGVLDLKRPFLDRIGLHGGCPWVRRLLRRMRCLIPSFQDRTLPVLRLGADDKEHDVREACDTATLHFKLTEADKAELLPSQRQTLPSRCSASAFLMNGSG